MLHAIALSFAQLGDPRIVRVIAASLALTAAVFVGVGLLIWWGITAGLAPAVGSGSGTLGAALAVVATLTAGWLLFRAIAIAVVGLFADTVVRAVEARHYPAALASARDVSISRAAAMGAASTARLLIVNLLLLPLYLILLATGIGTAGLFLIANGWLLGRDLGDMVAARHLPRGSMRDWRRATRGRRFALGLAGTGLLVVPVLNLVAPVLGAAMATHLFHGSRR